MTKSNKALLDDFITNNYNTLVVLARKICKKHSYHYDLLSETVVILYQELDKQDSKLIGCLHKHNELMKWTGQTMSNIHKWSSSDFNKNFTKEILEDFNSTMDNKDEFVISEPYMKLMQLAINEKQTDRIILQAEDTNKETKEFTQDYLNSGLNYESIEKYIRVMELKNKLQPHEQILFELYFENKMSTRKIANELTTKAGYPINYQSIHTMVRNIKNQILKQWN
jgi:hypothetical protein